MSKPSRKSKPPVAHGAHEFATALRQLEQAANNLSKAAADNGDDRCRKASALAMKLRNALVFGSAYTLRGEAEAVEAALRAHERGAGPRTGPPPRRRRGPPSSGAEKKVRPGA